MTLGKINIKSQSSRANESPTNANYRGVGLSEMIKAIQNKKTHKCNGNLSLHVLNIIDAIHKSAKKKKNKKLIIYVNVQQFSQNKKSKVLLNKVIFT